MRRRSRGCIRREDTMNVGMILPFSKNAYVGTYRREKMAEVGSEVCETNFSALGVVTSL